MKFSSYQRAVSPNVPNTPAVQAARDPMAYGGEGKQYSDMAASLGQVTKVATKQQDDQDAADVMDARNKIMTSLTEQLYGDNGLFVTAQGENAKGLTERTTQTIRKTFDDVLKNYDGRVRYAAQGNMNENMANFQRIAASKEMEEKLATDKANYASNLQLNTNLAAKAYSQKDVLNTYINDSARLTHARAAQEGWSGTETQAQLQNVTTQIVGGAVNAAMDDEEFDRANEILQANRGQMDQGTYGKFMSVLKKKQDVKILDQQATNIFSQCWDGQKYDMTKAYKMATDLYGPNAVTIKNGIDMKAAESEAWKAWGNTQMSNGTKGCVEAASKFAGYWNPWAANEQKNGVVSVPKLVSDASKDGGPGVIAFDKTKLQNGDMIVYASPTEGADAHVVVYTGNGPDDYNYIGNSSGQNMTVQGADYREMDGQTPTRIIKTGSVGGEQRSAYDPERLGRLKNVIDSYANEKIKEYEIEHPRPQVVYRGGSGRSGGSYRGGRSGYSGYSGSSGEYYTPAQIKRAQKLSNEYYKKAADPDATITDAQQERYDEAARILTDTGLVGSGDNLDSPDGYALAQAAWDKFKGEGDGAYTKAHDYLVENGMSYDEATTYLDGI